MEHLHDIDHKKKLLYYLLISFFSFVGGAIICVVITYYYINDFYQEIILSILITSILLWIFNLFFYKAKLLFLKTAIFVFVAHALLSLTYIIIGKDYLEPSTNEFSLIWAWIAFKYSFSFSMLALPITFSIIYILLLFNKYLIKKILHNYNLRIIAIKIMLIITIILIIFTIIYNYNFYNKKNYLTMENCFGTEYKRVLNSQLIDFDNNSKIKPIGNFIAVTPNNLSVTSILIMSSEIHPEVYISQQDSQKIAIKLIDISNNIECLDLLLSNKIFQMSIYNNSITNFLKDN